MLNQKIINSNKNIWSRRLALQAIYSWNINGISFEEILSNFKVENDYKKCNQSYFKEIVSGVINNYKDIDVIIEENNHLDVKLVNMVEMSIIRCAAYELCFLKKHDYKILISEYTKLSKKFVTNDSPKYVNAIVDSISKSKNG
tara:strand:- start:965 stop:1393 length:429 start_codon:yes stop_codon:yes gene_type:complete